MSDQTEPVEIPFDDDPGKQATLLLAAAEDLNLDISEVRTVTGGFLVSQEVADKAGLAPEEDADSGTKTVGGSEESDGDGEPDSGDEKPTKRAAAKKAATKDDGEDN